MIVDANHGILSPSATRFGPRDYATRIDAFRRAERLSVAAWAAAARVSRTQLGRYRAGEMEPGLDVVARLLAGASKLAHRTVHAGELYDLGDEEPVADQKAAPGARSVIRKTYQSKFDEFLLTHHVLPAVLARATGLSRQTLLRLRSKRSVPVVSTARAIVVALRRMGHEVVASDLWKFDRNQGGDIARRVLFPS